MAIGVGHHQDSDASPKKRNFKLFVASNKQQQLVIHDDLYKACNTADLMKDGSRLTGMLI